MLGLIEITPFHWAAFVSCVVVFLALDLGVFHRSAHTVKFREALTWSGVWFFLALLFALGLYALDSSPRDKGKEALEFLTGYLIELSLSMDNVFVIALIFAYFRVPSQYQHRVLFWGILGALLMRGVMICAGVALVTRVNWILWVCGAFLIYSGIKTLFVESEVEPEKSRVLWLARKLYPVAPSLDGQKFVTRWNGQRALTPLALVLLLVETSDLIFAVDSIPAVFAVTTKPFIVFTSNVFAILGLRTLYFVLAGAIGYFRYLKVGLSLVLVFIGVKMLLDPHESQSPRWFQVEIPTWVSLLAVASLIAGSMLLSILVAKKEGRGEVSE
jgi:tellurite resistance protein TerC